MGSSFCPTSLKKSVICSLQIYNSAAAASFTLIQIVKLLFILIPNFDPREGSNKKRLLWKNISRTKVIAYYKIGLLTNFILKEYANIVTNANFKLGICHFQIAN